MQRRTDTVAANIQNINSNMRFVQLHNVKYVTGQFLARSIPPAKFKPIDTGQGLGELGLLDLCGGLKITFELGIGSA